MWKDTTQNNRLEDFVVEASRQLGLQQQPRNLQTSVAANPSAIQSLLMDELAQLSLEEKQDIEDEIHGFFTKKPQETAEMIHESLLLMRQEVDRIPPINRQAYFRAMLMNRNTVDNVTPLVLTPEYGLKFLRAELFDARKAAVRYCKWLELLFEYYGDCGLMRQLYLSDLGTEELKFLKAGHIQLLPSRDRMGRRILAFVGSVGKGFSLYTRVKVGLFMYTMASDDEPTQCDGVVSIIWPSLELRDVLIDPAQQRKNTLIFEAMPLRSTGVHICLPGDDPVSKIVQALLLLCFGKDLRRTTKVHSASPTETEYCLKSEYGFPVDDIPLTNTGNIKTIQWRQWIKFREVVDAHCKHTGQLFSGVDCPDLRSVVFRTSGIMYDHPPNKVFRTILASKEQQRAEATTLLAKRQATEDVIREIYDLGFQFLLWNKDLGYYVPCSDQSEIKRHVFQSWRDQIKRSSAQQNRQALNSSNLEHVFANQDHHDNRGRDAMVGKKRKGEDQEGGCLRAFYR